MEHVQSLLELPFVTLAVLSAGYLSYRIAYTGKDETHSTIDVIFLTFVFAFVARIGSSVAIILMQCVSMPPTPKLAAVAGFLIAIVVASCWRKWFEALAFRLLRSAGISASDRQKSAWGTLLSRPPNIGPSRLYVRCTDGTRLLCERLADFETAPFGPCLLGQDGSVGIYVTHRKAANKGTWTKDQDPMTVDASWGFEMTFLSASQIAEVRINYPFTPSA